LRLSGPQPSIVSAHLVGYPFTLGFRPQLVVVSGLSVGCPFKVRSRPQLVFSGLSVRYPFKVGSRLSRSLRLSRSFFSKPSLSFLKSRLSGSPFANFFFHIKGFRLWQPFTNFSFSRWNFVYHGAFHELFFLTMEFRLSQSLSRTFLSHDGISAITEPFTNFSFTRWNFRYHRAFHKLFFYTMEFRKTQKNFWGKALFIYVTERVFT
jgi:hypothetical protein